MIIDTNTHPLSYIGNAYKELIRKLSDVQDERDLILKLSVIKDIPESTKDAMEQLEQLSYVLYNSIIICIIHQVVQIILSFK